MLNRERLALAVVPLLLACWVSGQECRPGDQKLLTGKETSGYYYILGKAIEKVANQEDPTLYICAQPVQETFNNIRELSQDHAAFAMVQSDVAHEAWYGHSPFPPGGLTKARIVMPMYLEAVHILRPQNGVSRLANLSGKKVYLGPKNSGSEFAAKHLLAAAGLRVGERPRDVRALPAKDYCEAIQRLKEGSLDAVFRATLVPSADVKDALDRNPPHEEEKKECGGASEIQLLALDYDTAAPLAQNGSYAPMQIPRNAYGLPRSTLTIGVPALLLTGKGVDDKDVAKLASILRRKRSAIEQAMREVVEQQHSGNHSDVTPQLSLMNVPLSEALLPWVHPLAKEYIYSAWRDTWIPLIPYIFGAFAPLIGLLAWKRAKIGGWLLRRPQLTFAVAGSLLIWVIASGVLFHFEWEWNEHFNSLPTAMRFGFLYLTSFPGFAPITPDGQSAVQIAKWISLLLFGGFVGPLLKEGSDTLGKHMSTWSQKVVPKSNPVDRQVLPFNHSVQSEEVASPASDMDAPDPAIAPGAD